MEVCVRSEEYRKAYDFADVKPWDTKDKITYCLRVKFADSIEYWLIWMLSSDWFYPSFIAFIILLQFANKPYILG